MKFFVSYAGPDEKWAKWVVWELQGSAARHECVAQFKDFSPGMNFMQKMREAAEADCTIALFSPSYFRSDYCEMELNAAAGGDEFRLLPVRLSECKPGRLLSRYVHIDLVKKTIDEAREELLGGVQAFVAQTVGNRPSKFTERPDFPGAKRPSKASPGAAYRGVSGGLNVLFLAPEVGELSPRTQLREMKRGLARARYPKSIVFDPAFDLTVSRLFEELNRKSADVLHLSGKQNGGDILMRTDDGAVTRISDLDLVGFIQSLRHKPKLVIVDTCFSLRCADRLSRFIPCTMGVEGSPYEDDATAFYRSFYHSIASGASVEGAYKTAVALLKSQRVKPVEIPQLRTRNGIDPAKMVLVKG